MKVPFKIAPTPHINHTELCNAKNSWKPFTTKFDNKMKTALIVFITVMHRLENIQISKSSFISYLMKKCLEYILRWKSRLQNNVYIKSQIFISLHNYINSKVNIFFQYQWLWALKSQCMFYNKVVFGAWGFVFCFCFFCFLEPHPQHMEVPRLGVESELQQLASATATATQDPSCVCDLHHSS